MARNVANTRASLPPGSERSTRRQIVMLECATEPYNPHLLGQAADERGNDGGMETLRGRRGGRMMERLLNIQQAVKSMQGVVGRLHYGGASVLHLFISSLFSILVPRLLSSVSSVPLVFFCHSFPTSFLLPVSCPSSLALTFSVFITSFLSVLSFLFFMFFLNTLISSYLIFSLYTCSSFFFQNFLSHLFLLLSYSSLTFFP